ncbi:hypothetical protein LCGC14_0415100 [marine sediment metagenome]|uniref:Helicase HerA central domain-containing protein n=1 Tax=marine sediment metagenome TaxID=412755 RepID=A0A0F9W1T5_9ZZZZ|nr:DUF87 domain-containing protein [archaeon]
MRIVGYQSRIRITQALPYIEKELILDPKAKFNHLINSSWLFDPFGDYTTYGAEFKVNESFSWDFFLYTKTFLEAKELGVALLMTLQEKFKGLDGLVETFPLYSEFLEIKRRLYEIKIPSNPPLKLHFLRKILNYYKTPRRKINLNMFILWKKDDLLKLVSIDRYMLKIFVSLNPREGYSVEIEDRDPIYRAVLKYLVSNMSIPPHVKVSFELLSPKKWRDILICDVFPTRSKYGIEKYSSVPYELLPNYIKPEMIDFTIPYDLPLPKPPTLANRNLINLPILKDDSRYLILGNKLIDGVLSNEKAAIEIDSLNTHLNIFGKSGTGKSTLMKIVIKELNYKRPDVGILIINLVKPDLEVDFPMVSSYKFPTERFKVPYMITGNRIKKSISRNSNVLAACLGLKYVGPVIISETLQRCYAEYGEFPLRITEFFNCVENNLKAKPYDPDTQKTILTAFKRRIDELFTNLELEKTLRFQREIPEWFSRWRNGDKILIDLTDCDGKEQHLLTMLIFQMIETLTPFDRSNKLRHLISIDEAHRVIGKSRDNDPESAEFIMKNRINAIFSKTIEECRSKGLGLLIAEQKPYLLLDSAIDSAAIKILFSLGYPSNELFTGNVNEREMLLNLSPRYALVINGTNSERYLSRTADDKDF